MNAPMNRLDAEATLKNKAYSIIKNKILTGILPPSSPVSEKELMEEIGVSRTPIREALFRLENENLVKVFPKRGIFVTGISEKEIVDIYNMRACIEVQAVRMATPNMDAKEDIDPFYDIFSRPDYSPAYEEHIDIDRRLHLRIANRSGNKYLEQVIAEMYDLSSRIRYLHISAYSGKRLGQSRIEHLDILDKMRARKTVLAEKAIRKHIMVGMEGALDLLIKKRFPA
jgi:DNA-binding GntR family transcriptional regulator